MSANEIANYLKREENATLSNLISLDINNTATYPLLVAPQGGSTLLRLHVLPLETYVKNASHYWVLSLRIYNPDGTEVRTIPLANCSLAVLPFAKFTTMTWPPTGRFDERLDERQAVHLQVDVTGSPGSDFLRVQLDHMRAGR